MFKNVDNNKFINLETGKVVFEKAMTDHIRFFSPVTIVMNEDYSKFIDENYQLLDEERQLYGLPFVQYRKV